jgi:hypothetical protein
VRNLRFPVKLQPSSMVAGPQSGGCDLREGQGVAQTHSFLWELLPLPSLLYGVKKEISSDRKRRRVHCLLYNYVRLVVLLVHRAITRRGPIDAPLWRDRRAIVEQLFRTEFVAPLSGDQSMEGCSVGNVVFPCLCAPEGVGRRVGMVQLAGGWFFWLDLVELCTKPSSEY